MNNQDWTPEEDEAFNAVEKQSNLGKQILRDIEGQPYVYAPKREWVGLTVGDYRHWAPHEHKILDWVANLLEDRNT